MNQLLDKLRAEDKFMLRLSKGIQIVYWILIPVYTLFFVANPGGEMSVYERIGGGFFVAAFLIFALIFNKQSKKFKNIDYSLPSVKMLEEVVSRYRLWKPELKWALLSVFLIDIGMSISGDFESESFNFHERIVTVQYLLLPTMVISFLIGVIWWYRKHKPLRDHAQQLLDELHS